MYDKNFQMKLSDSDKVLTEQLQQPYFEYEWAINQRHYYQSKESFF